MVPVPPQVFAFVMNAAEFKLGCRGSIFAPKISGYKLLRCAEKSSFTHRRVGAPQNGECMMLKCIFTSDDEAMFYLRWGGYVLPPPRRLHSTSAKEAIFYLHREGYVLLSTEEATSAKEATFYLRRGGYLLPPQRRLRSTSAEEVMSSLVSVCLLARLRKSYSTAFHTMWWRDGIWVMEETIRFWWYHVMLGLG